MKKRGFSIAELLIVVAVLGILAAIVVPQFRSHSTQAKTAVAKNSLRILRSAIELYTAQHGGIPPGYQNDNPQTVPSSANFYDQLVADRIYMTSVPTNSFNNLRNIMVVENNETFPQDAVDGYAWIYHPATKTIRLNWSGSDSSGLRYLDY